MTTVQKRRRPPLYGSGLRVPHRIAALFEACASSDRRACLFLAGLCLLAFLPGFFSIPSVDRDEARMAQVSRQMVADGDLADTRLGNERRRTSPLGLHWLQAATVKTAQAIGVPQVEAAIWVYRLPSLAGGILTVLLTYWAALLAATLLAASAALGVVAGLAVPDALFAAAIATSMGALGRAYLQAGASDRAVPLRTDLRHSPLPDEAPETAARSLLGRVAPLFPGFSAPPGAYALMFWGLFWPAAPLAALAVPILWKARRLRAVRFLLAWVLPTKLPVALLPVFPAVAVLVALAVERGALAVANMRLARLLWLWPLIGALIAAFALLGLAVFDKTTSLASWPLLLAGFFALIVAAVSVRDYGIEKAALLAVVGMLVSGFGVMQLILPQMRSLWVSPRLVQLASAEPCASSEGGPIVAAAGYSEPSLVFALPDGVRFMDGASAADFLVEGGCRVAFVERRQEARFVRRAEVLGLRISRGADVRGFNYSEGRQVRLSMYRKGD